MTISEIKIHEAVLEHYGNIAREFDVTAGAASCCDPGDGDAACCPTPIQFYDQAMTADLPFDVTGLSLGCGDPVTIAALNPGETVLDLGSGGGIDCFLAAKQVGEAGHVIGVDMTENMLAKANANRDKLGLANVEFRKGQIEALPVDAATVDVVISNCVINLSPDKPAVFRETFRVLKPGGRIAISDIVTEGDFNPQMRAELDKWSGCITGAIDIERYRGLMREAGYVDVAVANKVAVSEREMAVEDGPRVFSARITGRKPGLRGARETPCADSVALHP